MQQKYNTVNQLYFNKLKNKKDSSQISTPLPPSLPLCLYSIITSSVRPSLTPFSNCNSPCNTLYACLICFIFLPGTPQRVFITYFIYSFVYYLPHYNGKCTGAGTLICFVLTPRRDLGLEHVFACGGHRDVPLGTPVKGRFAAHLQEVGSAEGLQLSPSP